MEVPYHNFTDKNIEAHKVKQLSQNHEARK